MRGMRVARAGPKGETGPMIAQRTMTGPAWAQLLLLSGVWGTVFLSVRVALGELGFVTLVAHRVFWAALVLLLVVRLRGHRMPRDPRLSGAFLVMGILNNALPFGLQAWGQLHIPSGLVAILNAGTAITGMLVAAFFLPDERLTARRLAGAALGFAGVATAIGIGNLAALDLGSLAQLAVVASTVCYALAGVWARTRLAGQPGEVAAAGMLLCSAAVTVPAALLIDGAPSFDLAPGTVLALAHLSVVATAGAYLLYYSVLRLAGSANLMLCTLLIAPVAIGLGAAFLGERLRPEAWAGFALLAAGLLVIDGRALRGWRRGRRASNEAR